MHLHPHHSPMLYMKLQKDNSTCLRVLCAAIFYSRQGVCVSLSTPTCSREWWLNACKAFELHVPHQYQKEGAGAHLHPWRFPGSKDERTARFPRFLLSFSHLWSLEPMGPACPAAIRCLFCRNAGSHSSPGHYFPLHAPAEPLEAEDAHAPSPPVPVPANPTPALQAEETQPRLPQTSTKSLGLFSLGSTAQSCRPVPGVIYRSKN